MSCPRLPLVLRDMSDTLFESKIDGVNHTSIDQSIEESQGGMVRGGGGGGEGRRGLYLRYAIKP